MTNALALGSLRLGRRQPQSGPYKNDFESIPRTFWWALVTMTTVGYGDISPITPLGRLVAVFAMFSGIIIVALPITVIGANFEKQFEKQFRSKLG